MDRLARTIAVFFGCVLLSACQQTTSTPTADESEFEDQSTQRSANWGGNRRGNNLAAQALRVSKENSPDEVVRAFLDAARSGDETTAALLLTDRAREETDREGLALDPPGTPTMKYEIRKVEYHERDPHAAYVNSLWVESTGPGDDQFEVVWVLRRQSDGWRIAGMAAPTDPNQPPVFLNFEDPVDVARIKSQIGGEPGVEVAQLPDETDKR